jgi:hypothetical protein
MVNYHLENKFSSITMDAATGYAENIVFNQGVDLIATINNVFKVTGGDMATALVTGVPNVSVDLPIGKALTFGGAQVPMVGLAQTNLQLIDLHGSAGANITLYAATAFDSTTITANAKVGGAMDIGGVIGANSAGLQFGNHPGIYYLPQPKDTLIVDVEISDLLWKNILRQSFSHLLTLKYAIDVSNEGLVSLANHLLINAAIDVVDLGSATITISQAKILAEALQSNTIITEFKIPNPTVDALPVVEEINNIVKRNRTPEVKLVNKIKKQIVETKKFDLAEVVKILLSETYDLKLIKKYLEIAKHQDSEIQELYSQAAEDLYSWVISYIDQHLEKAKLTNKKHYGFTQDLMDEMAGTSMVKMLQNLYTEQVYKQFYEQYQIISNIIDAFNTEGNKQAAILLLRYSLPDIDQDLLKLYGVNIDSLDKIVEYEWAQNIDLNNQDDELPELIQNVSELGGSDNHLSELD